MVARLTSISSLIFIILSILSGLAMEDLLFAAESGHRLPREGKPEEAARTEPIAGLQATSLDLVLMGIVDGGSRHSRAVILSKKDKMQQIYQVGDMVGGARIKSILWGKVVLSTNGRDEVLDMNETARYRPANTAVAAPLTAPDAASGAPQDTIVASSGSGEEVGSRLIPERVRLVLPEEEGSGARNGE